MYLNQSVHLWNRIVIFLDIWILHRHHMGVSNYQLRNSTVCSTDCWGKYQRPRSWPFVRGIHRWPMVSPHKKPVTQPPFLVHCEENPSVTDGFPSQKASNAENIAISWSYQDIFHWSTHSSIHPFNAHSIINKNTLETCKNPRPTSGWSELTKSCTTSTMNFHMAYFSWIQQNNARLKLSCKFGESKCNPC